MFSGTTRIAYEGRSGLSIHTFQASALCRHWHLATIPSNDIYGSQASLYIKAALGSERLALGIFFSTWPLKYSN